MHSFLRASFRVIVIVLAATLALSLSAQSTRAGKKGYVTWTPQDNPGSINGRKQLDRLLQEQKLGKLPSESAAAVDALRNEVEWAELHKPWLVTIDFPGGSLANLLENLKGPETTSFNVISPGGPDFLDAELPAFSLRNANLILVAKVVGSLLEMNRLNLRVLDDSGPNAVVCVLTRKDLESANPPPPANFEAIQLYEHIFGEQTIDVIVDAIRTGWT
ncbi:MAG: hypothetical protein V4773_25080, partial [Verrucomicrobiota bacterium]